MACGAAPRWPSTARPSPPGTWCSTWTRWPRPKNENWVWKGANCLGGKRPRRCLISLSRGGADATVVREFDIATRGFVAGGFSLPEAKSELDWLDENRVFVGTDFGPGSMTDSGYPRQVKLWQRGQPLTAASTCL